MIEDLHMNLDPGLQCQQQQSTRRRLFSPAHWA